MFTGIVEGVGVVREVTTDDDGRRLRVETDLGPFEHGQSVSVSGACLTVEDSGALRATERSSGERKRGTTTGSTSETRAGSETTRERSDPRDGGADYFDVFTAAETVEKTYLGDLEVGDRVNVERAMPADGRFDGHVVQGHVDTTTEVVAVERVGEDWRFTFAIPEGFGRYLVPKGSVTLDGISLTVAELDDEAGTFSVAIIPTTYDLTTLSGKQPGDPVHVEVDVLAKYVERLLDYS